MSSDLEFARELFLGTDPDARPAGLNRMSVRIDRCRHRLNIS
jgi:hypothetical protein